MTIGQRSRAGADSDTFERGGVNLNLAFDVASKSILLAYQKF